MGNFEIRENFRHPFWDVFRYLRKPKISNWSGVYVLASLVCVEIMSRMTKNKKKNSSVLKHYSCGITLLLLEILIWKFSALVENKTFWTWQTFLLTWGKIFVVKKYNETTTKKKTFMILLWKFMHLLSLKLYDLQKISYLYKKCIFCLLNSYYIFSLFLINTGK